MPAILQPNIPRFLNAQEMGFSPALPGQPLPSSTRLMSRYETPEMMSELQTTIDRFARGELGNDVNEALAAVTKAMSLMNRAITSTTPNLPVREDLEAEVTQLVPTDTPLRNMIPRVPIAGSAHQWRQLASFGGGWGTSLNQPGGGDTSQRIFFGETGAPGNFTETYLNQTKGAKLLGAMGDITGFSMAVGANFFNQYAQARTNSIVNMMLNEENAIVNADSSSKDAPWGDGTNALAFDGLTKIISTANGVPTLQVQTGVGALTFDALDAQIARIWNNGGRDLFILITLQEALSIQNIAQATGTLNRVMVGANNAVVAGLYITGYVNVITGEVIPFKISRFVPSGTIIIGAMKGPTGQATLEMGVLPQVQLPQLAPNTNIQGYVAQELAPTAASPQVFPWLLSVYEVLMLKNGKVWVIMTGVTAV